MGDVIRHLFDVEGFPARWHCGSSWSPSLGWFYILSDLAIWGAYAAIPVLLAYFVWRRKDVPFARLFVLFSLFITSCGFTHLIDAIIFWHPVYRLAAVVLMLTAVISWATVLAMVPVLPRALALPGLAKINNDLQREVAERRRAEDALRRAQLELERRVAERTAELSQTAAELERSNIELQQFAYVASHDLQEPLRMVASYLQLLERHYKPELDDDAKQYIGFAVDGALRMQTLIRALLDYSRVETRARPFERIDANLLVEQALTNLRASIEDAHAVVTVDRLPTVLGDPSQLTQLLQNLIGNAVKFHAEQPPRVHIGRREGAEDWIFSVQDNGIGIDPQFQDRIFEIFTRLQRRDRYPGTGIGLAICRRVVERHGGRIWVESAPGQGSTFYFTLPRSEVTTDDGR